MAERELKKGKAEEDIRHKKKARESAQEKVMSRDETPEASAAEATSLEGHAALVTDVRLSQPASAEQKTHIVSGLQRSHGNAYVQRLLKSRSVQAKLTVNPPDDQYEREADRVAGAVVENSQIQRQEKEDEEEEKVQTKPIASAQVQRQAEEEEEEKVQTKAAGNQVPEVSDDLEMRINAARGSGQNLPDSVRASLEPHLGHDFSQVRLHTDAEASELSGQLQAKAFTTGQDIFFRSGDYQPESDEGRKLLGHEMTHVVQQRAASVSKKDPEEKDKATSEPSPKWGQGQKIGPAVPAKAEKKEIPTRDVCSEAVQYIRKIHKEGQLLTEDQVREAVRMQFVYLRDNFYKARFDVLKLKRLPMMRVIDEYIPRVLALCREIEREAREQIFSLLSRTNEPFMDVKSEYASLKDLPLPSGY